MSCLCPQIRGLVSSPEAGRGRPGMQARLEALRPAVAAACRALCGLKATYVFIHLGRFCEAGRKLGVAEF